MKKVITATVVAACIALSAAVWPQSKAVEKTLAPTITPAVRAPEATVAKLKTEAEPAPLTEKEETVDPQTKDFQEVHPEPEPESIEISVAPEAQPTPEPEAISEESPKPAEEQTTDIPQSGDMVYVPGFGWIESQGPGHVDYAEDVYESGNKIGIMG